MQKALNIMAVALVAVLSSFASSYAEDNNDQGRMLGNFCSSCHGTNGVSIGDAVPSIGGQHKEFLIRSLKEMKPVVDKKGNDASPRYSTLMKIFVKGYTDKEIEQIADWYSTREWKNTTTKPNNALIKQAKLIKDQEGNSVLENCLSCHSLNIKEEDMDKGIPRISGQPSLYLKHSLMEYKEGKRKGERAAEMEIVKDLSEKDLEALAEYFAHDK